MKHNEPLTDEELAKLRKRVTYLVESAESEREHWIDAEIWQRTLATIDDLRARLGVTEEARKFERGEVARLTARLGKINHEETP